MVEHMLPAEPLTPAELRDSRTKLGLSIAQMSLLLGVSPTTLEAWESGRRDPKVDLAKLSKAMRTKFMPPKQGPNVVLGQMTVKAAREILGETCDAIAHRFGYSEKSWRAIEQGRRRLPEQIRDTLELLIKKRLRAIEAKR